MKNGINCSGLHDLKTEKKYFLEILTGVKKFELRFNDRDFKVGDFLRLKEIDQGELTGRSAIRIVSYVLKDVPNFGLKDGFVILGLV